jgi:acetylornithine deacetylase
MNSGLLDQTEAILADLIAYPTISTDPNAEMIADLANRLEAAGARAEVLDGPDGKANLFATFGPDEDGGIVLSGHTDVVPVADQAWTSDPFALAVRDDRLFGRGTCDMKGFIAACVALAPRFAAAARTRPLHMAFTHDEETGCLGAQDLVAALRARGLKPATAIIGEPTSMRVIEGHKGCYEYSTHFSGLEGHGSAPDAGVNAVEYAARYVGRLLELREDLIARTPDGSQFEPPWTTLNVGAVEGGVAHNVIAGKARVDWEMRPVVETDADFVKTEMAGFVNDRLLPAMRAIHPDAGIALEIIGEVRGLSPAEQNEARDIVFALTGANTCDLVAFGTEAGLFQTLGMDVVVCGPGSIEQAHKPDEYLARDQLGKCLKMLEALAARL